ncbi:MAG: Rrf2 family transcriptional regulator [Candidatus Cloacimonadaceae bacterium]|nr:Rrf2 family transcriptional regulator [Candidatus Cloacimonadaceae bacterium]MDP3114039.1 Rrf2 family transcriptional regulator [Candidatus Cloacimonadaceae bacterium]
MAVNTRTEYALRALIEMIDADGGQISAQKICERQHLPKKYVEHLLGALKAAKLIISSAGAHGGYILAKKAEETTLLDVMEAVDDASMLSCAGDRERFCLGLGCQFSPFFDELSAKQRKLFQSYNLKKIHKIYKGDKK